MKRIKVTAICISLLMTLSVVGCVTPPGAYVGTHRTYMPNTVMHSGGCDACGPVEACGAAACGPPIFSTPSFGQVGYSGLYCPPPRQIIDCRATFSNLSNGMFLTGRGILDVTAAPFITISNLLSHNYRYEVLAYCNTADVGVPVYQTTGPCCSVESTGCSGCDNGLAESMRYKVTALPNTMPNVQRQAPVPPALPRRNNPVVQASHLEPTAPVVRFVNPNQGVR